MDDADAGADADADADSDATHTRQNAACTHHIHTRNEFLSGVSMVWVIVQTQIPSPLEANGIISEKRGGQQIHKNNTQIFLFTIYGRFPSHHSFFFLVHHASHWTTNLFFLPPVFKLKLRVT